MAVEKKSMKDLEWEEENTFFGIPLENDNPFSGNPNPTIKTDDEPGNPPVEGSSKKKGEGVEEDEEDEDISFNFGDDSDSKPKVKKESKEDEDDDSEEDDDSDDEDDKDSKEDSQDEDEDEKFYSSLAKGLKEKGIFQNVDLEGKELKSDDDLYDLIEAEAEARIEETFEAFAEDMDEDAKAFIKFKKSGGRTEDFFAVYRNSVSLTDIDIEDEKDQEKVAMHYAMVIEGLEEEEAKDRVEWLKENGKLGAKSVKWHEKLQNLDKQNREAIVRQTQEQEEARRKNAEKFTETLKTTLTKVENVGQFKFSPTDKKELGDFIAKPTVKVGKNNYITPFQKAMSDILRGDGENMNKLLLLAKLVKSDFTVEDLKATAKTEVVRESRKVLKQIKSGSKPVTHSNKKRLADYFS
jgi:hypothetical protein